jgi:hypothetical protein
MCACRAVAKERGKGYMELNDSGGLKMVEAGMLKWGSAMLWPLRRARVLISRQP